MAWLRCDLFMVWFLVGTGLAEVCKWEIHEKNLGSPVLAEEIHGYENVSGEQQCLETCCSRSDCDLAWVRYPMDVKALCVMVRNCWSTDKNQDVCVLVEGEHGKVFRKKRPPTRISESEPRQDETNNSETEEAESPGGSEPAATKTVRTQNIDLSADDVAERCEAALEAGPCKALFQRWYYDKEKDVCQRFVYGGCRGNRNNYESEESCLESCKLKVLSSKRASGDGPKEYEDKCTMTPDPGPCRASFPMFYYDTSSGNCKSFTYGGCRGNNNRYNSKEECLSSCNTDVTVLSTKRASGDGLSPKEYEDKCTMTPDPGPCRAAFPMFYYDTSSGNCKSFTYGGCRGNNNRYNNKEECLSSCSTDGHLDTRGHDDLHHHSGAAVFVLVSLAVLSALMLLTLLVVSLKRRNLFRRHSSVSDKEELLPDDHSSMDSLSLPESPKPDKA